MHDTLADARLALRSLAREPGFAAVALLTIALGVGANTAVFSVVNAVLIQPLPFPNADRLVAIHETVRRTTLERRAVSYANFRDWERSIRGADLMSPVDGSRFTMTVGDSPERLSGERVSAGYFDALGVKPALGRVFTRDDDAEGAAPVVVLGDGLWARAFNRDPRAIGAPVLIDGELCTIVGIMPAGFRGLRDSAELWGPIARFTDAETLKDRGSRGIPFVVARLAPGTTIAQLEAELTSLARELERAHAANRDRGARVLPLREEYFGDIRPMLLVLLGAVGFVLLIACVNVANLLLARGSTRDREVAVRSALGARRGRIVRQLLTESMVLAVLGGAAGLLAAFWTIDLLVALSPVPLPTFVRIDVDVRVLGFALVACIAGGLLFGVAPAVAGSRTDLNATLKVGGRGGGDARSSRLRRGLVVAQIALALVLLAGAGLMLRTLEGLRTLHPGFEPRGLVMLRVAMPSVGRSTPPDPAAATQFARTLLAGVRELPSIESASLATDVPLGPSTSATRVTIAGREEHPIRIYHHAISPGHFRTLGVPLLEGRDFTDADGQGIDRRVAIVSRTMARRYWPAGAALHQRIRMADRDYEVIGIVGDLKHRDLIEAESADPDIYFPLLQLPADTFVVVARASSEAEPVVSAIRALLRRVEPSAPIFGIATGEELRSRQTSSARFSTALLGAFALVALTLTMIGIYGVTAYTVSRQTRQVGIRMALGATRGQILRLVLGGGLRFIAIGLAAGTLAAVGLTRLLSSLIYGVTATDPLTFGVATAFLGLVAVLACLLPAARASRIDPAVALRAE